MICTAVLNVNPTRMELTQLKRKLTTARRGHKLLKDKRDELMRRFLDLVRENKRLRAEVEEGLKKANGYMALARSSMRDEVLNVALMMPKEEMYLEFLILPFYHLPIYYFFLSVYQNKMLLSLNIFLLYHNF